MAKPSGRDAGCLDGLLCVANFPSNTGFAWDFIEGIYAGLADRMALRGIRTYVSYPEIREAPRSLMGSRAEPIVRAWDDGSVRGMLRTARTLTERRIRAVYLADRSAWSFAVPIARMAGVRAIICHDHSSGARDIPSGVRRLVKGAVVRTRWLSMDRVIAVSDYVRSRKIAVERLPPSRVVRIWNSIEVPAEPMGAAGRAHLLMKFGLDPDRPVVGCAARAVREKGVAQLLRAFEQVASREHHRDRPPQLLYMGDGPLWQDLCRLRADLTCASDVAMPGYVPDARMVLGAVDLAVVPSIWEEAFGLAALEPLGWGVPVIASRVGGLPEVVRDGVDGLLMEPGDEGAAAEAIDRMLRAPELRAEMGLNGRQRAMSEFTRDAQLAQLEDLFLELLR